MKVAAVIFILSFVCQSPIGSALENSKFHKVWNFNGSNGRIRSGTFDPVSKQFLFASCNEEKLPYELSCVVTIEILREDGVTPFVKMCHLHIDAGMNKNLTMARLRPEQIFDPIQFLGKTKVIIAWLEIDSFAKPFSTPWVENVTILDWVTCKSKHLSFSVGTEENRKDRWELSESNIVVYQETFDVFVADKDKCGGVQKCRLTYNLEGDKINGPEPISTGLDSVSVEPALQNSPSKGFFVVNQLLGYTDIFHVSTNGTKSPLMTVLGHQVFVKSSNTHEKYTNCWREGLKGFKPTSFQCLQYDIDNITAIINTTLSYPERVDQLAVQNLPGGGFVVFAIECALKENDYSIHYSVANASVTEVDIHGNKNQVLKQELELEAARIACFPNRPTDGLRISIDKGKLCYYLSYVVIRPPGFSGPEVLVFQTECFTNHRFD